MKLTLEQFCAQVNALSKKESDRLNAKHKAGLLLFPATCIQYPSHAIKYLFEDGLTPAKAFKCYLNVAS